MSNEIDPADLDEQFSVIRTDVKGNELKITFTLRAICRFMLADAGWAHDTINRLTDDELLVTCGKR